MKKHLHTIFMLACTCTFFAPVSSAFAKRKTCRAKITVRNRTGKYIKVKKIKTQRKGGTIFYRSTFWEGSSKKKIDKDGNYTFVGTFKINKSRSCSNKRLWNIHYNRGNSVFLKVGNFKWLKGSKSGTYYTWGVTVLNN